MSGEAFAYTIIAALFFGGHLLVVIWMLWRER
jgi:hypothetical protein